ncbi:MAG TPA: hypothetical protein PLS84_11460, partial [Salinivirgaceae bacterium]|nr:hypothetical protein [Salinivirgaceae bacterium]
MKIVHYYFILIVITIISSCQDNKLKYNASTTNNVQLIPLPNKIKVGQDSIDIASGLKLNFTELNPEIENNLTTYLKSTT